MTPRRKKRLLLVGAVLLGVAGATALFLTAFQENIVYFYSPSEVVAGEAPADRTFRIGGLVKEGSVERSGDEQSLEVRFVITDNARDVPVVYDGILPDLFREGQGIVANGKLSGEGVFLAEKVLAKHDESYMPPEAAQALEQAEKMPDHGMVGEDGVK